MKTLKDMDFIEGQIHISKLKQEAINWIHGLRNLGLDKPEKQIQCASQTGWIRMFFDITDEDLNTNNSNKEKK